MGRSNREDTRRPDNCLVLLVWAEKNPEGPQSWRSLAKGTGIPYVTLFDLIAEHQDNPHGSTLAQVAYRYRFKFRVYRRPRKGRKIDAVKVNDYDTIL